MSALGQKRTASLDLIRARRVVALPFRGASNGADLVLHELSQGHFARGRKSGEDVALIIDADFFRCSDGGIRQWDEGNNFAVLSASDTNSPLEAGIGFIVGLRIRDIDCTFLSTKTLLGRPNCFHSSINFPF